jgi:hypothetical protein
MATMTKIEDRRFEHEHPSLLSLFDEWTSRASRYQYQILERTGKLLIHYLPTTATSLACTKSYCLSLVPG